jgi:DNA invertase Pin-like site-specific DNA recombinase
MGPYVIYARKSTESEDKQILSIDSQVAELEKLAVHHEVPIAEVLTESRSAKAPGRPIFGNLMERVHAGQIGGIFAWKMDRLARNHYDTGVILQALAEGQLERIITSDGVKTSNSNDRLMGTFELALATKFIDDLRQNVKRGNRARFERGWPNFPPPLGYMNDRLARTIVRDPERFESMRRMWDLLLQGAMSPQAIAQIANRQWGFRTRVRAHQGGGPLSHSTLYDSFRNPYYMGIIRLADGRVYLGKHEPMVTKAEFEQAQRILSVRSRPRAQKLAFAFSGLMVCGYCGAAVTAEQHFSGGRRYVYYHCSRSKVDRPCHEPAIREEALVEQIAEFLGTLRVARPIHETLIAQLDRLDAEEERITGEQRHSLESSIRDCDQQSDALLEVRLGHLIADEEFMRKRTHVAQKKQELETELRRLDAHGLGGRVTRARKMANLAQTAKEAFLAGSDPERKALLQELAQVITLQGGRVRVRVVPPLRAATSGANLSANSQPVW